MAFGIQFDFDQEGDPPSVYIADKEGRGTCCVEVLEEPKLKNAAQHLSIIRDKPWKKWSWEDEDWEPGPVTKAIVNFMNSSAYKEIL